MGRSTATCFIALAFAVNITCPRAFAADQPRASNPPEGSLRLNRTLAGHKSKSVWFVRFSPDGKLLASAGDDGAMRLWDVGSGKVVAQFKSPRRADTYQPHDRLAAFSPDNQRFAAESAGKITLWSVESAKVLAVLPGDNVVGNGGRCISIDFSPDGKQIALASGGRTRRMDRNVTLWDADSGRLVRMLQGHQADVWSVSFAGGGKTLRTWDFDSVGIEWDVASGNQTKTFKAYRSSSGPVRQSIWLTLAPDGKTAAESGRAGTLLHDLTTGKTLQKFAGAGPVAISPSGKLLASGGGFRGASVKLFDTATGSAVASLPDRLAGSLAFSPDGNLLAVGDKNSLTLWEVTPRTRR